MAGDLQEPATELRDKGHKSAWGQVKDRTKSFKEKEKLKWTNEGRKVEVLKGINYHVKRENIKPYKQSGKILKE